MQALKKIAKYKSMLAFIDQALFSGTSFSLTLVLAQKMDIKSFGLYSSVVLVVYLLVSVYSAILIQPFQVSYSKIKEVKQYVSFLFLGLFILITVTAIVLYVPLCFLYRHNNQMMLGAFLCFCAGFLINDFFRKLFLGLGNTVVVLVMDILYFFVLVYLYNASALALSGVLWVLGVSNIVATAPGLLIIIKQYSVPTQWRLFLQDHTNQCKWLLSVAILQWCSSNFFVLVSGMYLGIEALGALRLVQSFFGVINVGLQTIENYFVPKIAALYSQSTALAKAYLLKLAMAGLVIFATLLLPVFIFSDYIIVLAGGAQYKEYGYVVKMMCVLYLFIFLCYPARISIRILILNKVYFFGYLISFIISFASFHFLLQWCGLYGAIIGLIANQLVMMLYWQNQLNNKQFMLWK